MRNIHPVRRAALLLCLVAAGATRAQTVRPAPLSAATYELPGRLVGLPDARKLNIRCLGKGAPTVILESGFGADSQGWGRVQPIVAATTRVCAYDRAGYGYSDPGLPPRDGATIARELDRGLRAAGVSGPFVVVGHSAGGLYARLFAARRPRDVVGLVFVDSSVDHQPQRLAALFGAGAGSIDGVRRRPARCLAAVQGAESVEKTAALGDCVPPRASVRAQLIARRPATWRAQLSELDTLFTTTSDQVVRTGDLLKNVPTIVLTAAKADGVAAGSDDRRAMAGQALQKELAASFSRSDQRFVRSSHLMMNDRPEVIADATVELVTRARAGH